MSSRDELRDKLAMLIELGHNSTAQQLVDSAVKDEPGRYSRYYKQSDELLQAIDQYCDEQQTLAYEQAIHDVIGAAERLLPKAGQESESR